DTPDMTVLAISAADLISRSNDSGPYRSCGPLRNGLQLEGCFALGRKPLIRLLDRFLDVDGFQMAVQLRLDASRMHGCGAYAIPSVTPVESNGEEDVRRLGPAVGDPWVVRCPLKVGIFKVDVGEAVPGRGKVDQTPSFADKWRDTVNEHEVSQMIGPELHFKAVRRTQERRGHHSCDSDDHVVGFPLRQERIGTASYSFEIGKINRNQLETAATGRCLLP